MSNMNEWKLGDSNRTCTYILPMLGNSMEEFYIKGIFPRGNFVNSFVGDNTSLYSDYCILLLYKFNGKLEYLDFEDKLMKHPEYEAQYSPDKPHVMYVFNIPEKYKEDYQKILDGKYSRISDEYKRHILQFHKFGAVGPVYEVLYRQEAAFKRLEDLYEIKLNRNTDEASSKFIRDNEYYQEKYKIKDSLDSGDEFNMKESLGDNIN